MEIRRDLGNPVPAERRRPGRIVTFCAPRILPESGSRRRWLSRAKSTSPRMTVESHGAGTSHRLAPDGALTNHRREPTRDACRSQS
jgi:hypothetical protein